MKKFIIALAVIILCAQSVFAGDIPEGIMSGGYCDMMFIGEIEDVRDNAIVITPTHTMMGEAVSSIEVQPFKYIALSEKPKVGDIVVAIAKDYAIDTSWIFRATSADYKTLKLECPNDPNQQNSSNMIYRYNQFINEGKYIRTEPVNVTTSSNNNVFYWAVGVCVMLGVIVCFAIIQAKRKN